MKDETTIPADRSLPSLRQWDAELTGKIAAAAERGQSAMVARLGLVRSDVQKRIAAATIGQMRCA